MRMTRRFDDESGVTAVIVAILILVIVGMLALTVDGGLLWTKHRQVRAANDAAALAAAYSCGTGEGLSGANLKADEVAVANVSDAVQVAANDYPEGCEVPAGEVIVEYGGQQGLLFGPAIGVSSPKPVVATATARWGAAGGASNVAPLMLSLNRLSDCGIPNGPGTDGLPLEIGVSRCFFWWDNGNANDQTELTNAEWGLVALDSWRQVDADDSCGGYQSSQQDVSTWIEYGYPETMMVEPDDFVYVCRGSGFQGNALNNDINNLPETQKTLLFPVNDPNQQVDASGIQCPPEGGCTVDKYAIIGFAVLRVQRVWTGHDAETMCNHEADNQGSLRCLEAVWMGFQPNGVLVDGDAPNLGLFAIALTG